MIKGAGDGEVIFDGDGAYNLFNLMAANYNYFEGLTIRNTELAFLLRHQEHRRRRAASPSSTARSTTSDAPCSPIGRARRTSTSPTTSSSAGTIPIKLMGWTGRTLAELPGVPSKLLLRIRGQGLRAGPRRRVQLHRALARRHRHRDLRQSRRHPNPIHDRLPVSIDFYNNDIYNMERQLHRIRRRRAQHPRLPQPLLQLSAAGALSVQPMFGGPVVLLSEHRLQHASGRRAEVTSTRRRAS